MTYWFLRTLFFILDSQFFFLGSSLVLCLSFDTISVVPWSDPAENIGPILCMAITRQLKLIMEDLKEQLRHTSIRNIDIPKIFHFYPESLQHYVTLVYHPQRSEQSLGIFFFKIIHYSYMKCETNSILIFFLQRITGKKFTNGLIYHLLAQCLNVEISTGSKTITKTIASWLIRIWVSTWLAAMSL